MCPVQIAIAFLAYAIALKLNPGARLVGPFLLLSPILALTFVSLVNAAFRGQGEQYERFIELEDRVGRLDHKLKKLPDIFAFTDPKSKGTVQVFAGRIYVNTANWSDLNWAERDFLLARAIAKLEEQASHNVRSLFVWGGVLIGGVLAALNLWSILATHAVAAFLFFHGSIERQRMKELEADRRAVRLTGNKHAAQSVVRREAKTEAYPIVELPERLAAIEAA